MPTTTLKEAERALGISHDDTVQYEKNGDEAVIRVQLQVREAQTRGKKKTAKEIFEWIVENGEPLGTKDWARDFKEGKKIQG